MYPAILVVLLFAAPVVSIRQLPSLWPQIHSTVESLVILAIVHAAMSTVAATFYRRNATYQRIVIGAALILLLASIVRAVSVVLAAAHGTLFWAVDPVLAVGSNAVLPVCYALLLWPLLRLHLAANNRMERSREP
jgi:hypothetical protein